MPQKAASGCLLTTLGMYPGKHRSRIQSCLEASIDLSNYTFLVTVDNVVRLMQRSSIDGLPICAMYVMD